jgi:hypothetical protein
VRRHMAGRYRGTAAFQPCRHRLILPRAPGPGANRRVAVWPA